MATLGSCLCGFLVLTTPLASTSEVAAASSGDNGTQLAIQAFNVLHKQWWSSLERTFTHGIKPIGWWNTANGVEIAANILAIASPQPSVQKIARQVIEGRFDSEPRLLIKADKSYDDQGWMVHSWLRAYEELGDRKYLDRAKSWYDNLRSQAWDRNASCSLGIWWAGKPNLHYKNAIANSLTIRAAAKLSKALGATEGAAYLRDAKQLWAWFEVSGLIAPEGTVYDGKDEVHGCAIQPDEWTYNSGSLIGALASLYDVTGNATLVDVANKVAAGAISHFTASSKAKGVVEEPREYKSCADDCKQFKGVLMRHLDYFVQVAGDGAQFDHGFFTAQLRSLVANDCRDGAYGLHWSGPFDDAHPISQMSAIDALLAAARHAPRAAEEWEGVTLVV